MATKRAKAVGVGKLGRAKKVTAKGPDLKQFRLRYGTPNQMCEPIKIATEKKVRDDIIKHLEGSDVLAWCERYNKAGIEAINQMKLELSNTQIHIGKSDPDKPSFSGSIYNTGNFIQGCYDEMYGLTIRYEFWKEWT